jgi:2'-5' RNA ligase
VTLVRRAFVAVVPPPAVLDAVASVIGEVGVALPGVRWTRRNQWHVTVRFLGRVPNVEELAAAVGGAVAGRERFRLRLHGLGGFPKPSRATVLWCGVTGDLDELHALVATVERAVAGIGFAPETRAFTAHLTLARLARATSVVDALRDRTGDIGPSWTATDLVLYESDTRRDGAVHTECGRFVLGE